MPFKKGFGSPNYPKDKHREISSRGGKKTGAKGYALLTPEARSENARIASRTRWDKVKEERQRADKQEASETLGS